jgi:hypothetical protein
MKHCVATRAQYIRAGRCYIYRVLVHGERGTLQVGLGLGGFTVDEFQLAGNADPSPEAWGEAVAWVERAWIEGQRAKSPR